MKRFIQLVMAVVAMALLAGGGYWLGQRHSGDRLASAVALAEKPILYYRNPMGLPDTSPVPKKDAMGMDYIAVYAGEEGASTGGGKGKIVYYRNPMGLPDTSPVPKKDSMGMDYVPVYESEVSGPNFVRITPEKIQRLGVKTVAVTSQPLSQSVRAVGQLAIDERAIVTVAPRFEGWIEKLAVSAVGDEVRRGQILFEAYSPDIYAAQQEYRLARHGATTLASASADARHGVGQLAESGLARLKQWDISAGEIARLQNGGEPRRTVSYSAPISGVVLEKTAIQGGRFMPGDVLFKIADLSRVWLLLDLAEQDLQVAKVGNTVRVTLDAYPGETFVGKVEFIYPTLNTETRTARVRVILVNSANKLKPGLYAQAELAGGSAAMALVVPETAVIDSGKRQVVLVSLGDGRFEAREVKLGQRHNGFMAVQSGVNEGEQVVVSANFLIDAESNLKAALATLGSNTGNALPIQPAPAPHGSDASVVVPAVVNAHGGH